MLTFLVKKKKKSHRPLWPFDLNDWISSISDVQDDFEKVAEDEDS